MASFALSGAFELFKAEQDCRDAAATLIHIMEPFVSIRERIPELQGKAEPKRIVLLMVSCVRETCEYITQESRRHTLRGSNQRRLGIYY